MLRSRLSSVALLLGACIPVLVGCALSDSQTEESVGETQSHLVTAKPASPGAARTVLPPSVNVVRSLATRAGVSTEFGAMVSSAESTITRVEWDFDGDGAFDWSSERDARVRHTYTKAGQYKAVLRATDRRGTQTSRVVDVTVASAGARAASPAPGAAGRLVTLAAAPTNLAAVSAADGTVNHYAVLVNGASEGRFWEDVQFAYSTLTERLGYTADHVHVLNHSGTNPDGNNPNNMIDGAATRTNLANTFSELARVMDGDDELLVWFTDHGNGYMGPKGRAQVAGQRIGYAGHPPHVDPNDEHDYLESDFKLRSYFVSNWNSGREEENIGLNQWMVTGNASWGAFHREMFVSHFNNVYFADSNTIESNSDVFIEKFVDFLAGDLNHDDVIDTAAGESLDFDGDGNMPYDPATGTFDEDDWGSVDFYESRINYMNTSIPEAATQGGWQNAYMLFDENLDDRLDVDFAYDLSNLHADGTDLDNDGVFDRVDVNLDGDYSDWVSMDESVSLWMETLFDDDLASMLSPLKYGNLVAVFEQCFSGGFINDLSGPRRSIASAAIEETYSWGNDFIRAYTAAAGGQDNYGNAVNADTDGDGKTSVMEIFNFASSHAASGDTPQYDDNADTFSHFGPLPNGNDGALGATQFVGMKQAAPTAIDLLPYQNGRKQTVNGSMTFRLTSGSQGVIQINQPWQSSVQYSVNGSALQPTPAPWGGAIRVPYSSVVLLTLVTKSPQDIVINWW